MMSPNDSGTCLCHKDFTAKTRLVIRGTWRSWHLKGQFSGVEVHLIVAAASVTSYRKPAASATWQHAVSVTRTSH